MIFNNFNLIFKIIKNFVDHKSKIVNSQYSKTNYNKIIRDQIIKIMQYNIKISISEKAEQHFCKLLENQEKGTNIRIFVVHPGTAVAECGVSYCPSNAIEETDTEFQYNGFKAYVDEVSLPFLDQAEIDYVQEDLGYQLTLKAPNARVKKVAEDAPLIERVDYVIQAHINPQLASHGGKVTLLDITDEQIAILQFGGGCNGCSMVDYTLKEGIEKQLLGIFPDELKGVRDVTEHQRGEHSYY